MVASPVSSRWMALEVILFNEKLRLWLESHKNHTSLYYVETQTFKLTNSTTLSLGCCSSSKKQSTPHSSRTVPNTPNKQLYTSDIRAPSSYQSSTAYSFIEYDPLQLWPPTLNAARSVVTQTEVVINRHVERQSRAHSALFFIPGDHCLCLTPPPHRARAGPIRRARGSYAQAVYV